MGTNSRWKNYGLWVSLLSLAATVAVQFNPSIADALGQWKNIAQTLLGILVGAGILSNPTDGIGYGDTIKQPQVEPPSTNSP